jgi:hypothetical protein
VAGLIDPSRSPLGSVLGGVAIEQPVYFHGGPGAERPESPGPPTSAYWHLEVRATWPGPSAPTPPTGRG